MFDIVVLHEMRKTVLLWNEATLRAGPGRSASRHLSVRTGRPGPLICPWLEIPASTHGRRGLKGDNCGVHTLGSDAGDGAACPEWTSSLSIAAGCACRTA